MTWTLTLTLSDGYLASLTLTLAFLTVSIVDDGDGRRMRMRIGYRKAGGKLASFREEYLKKEITESEAGEDAGDRVGETK